MSNIPTLKLVLIGYGWVGKKTFLERHTWCELLETKHVGVVHGVVEIWSLKFVSNRGPVIYNVWIVSARAWMSGGADRFLAGAHGCIFMFDVSSRITYRNVPNWYRDVTRVCGEDFPVVLVGNKVDIKDRKVKAKHVTFPRKKGCMYYDMSGRMNFNCEKPFLWIARQLAGDETLRFVTPNLLQTELDAMYQEQNLPLLHLLNLPANQPAVTAVGFSAQIQQLQTHIEAAHLQYRELLILFAKRARPVAPDAEAGSVHE